MASAHSPAVRFPSRTTGVASHGERISSPECAAAGGRFVEKAISNTKDATLTAMARNRRGAVEGGGMGAGRSVPDIGFVEHSAFGRLDRRRMYGDAVDRRPVEALYRDFIF